MAAVGVNTGPMIVIGDIMLDILIKPKGPIRTASDTDSDIRLSIGGAGANTAIHLARSGVPTMLLGRVGDDDIGRLAISALKEANLTAAVEPVHGAPTGAIGVMIDHTGQRTMFPQRGANTLLDEQFVRRRWPGAVRGLFVSGYALFEPSTRAAARVAIQLTKEAGGVVAVDPASYAMIEDVGAERFLRWTEGADIILPNRDELRVLAKPLLPAPPVARPPHEVEVPQGTSVSPMAPLDEYKELLAKLAATFGTVVAKLDSDGAIGQTDGEPVHVPARHVDVVDTTGAGDAFNAGFLAAYLGTAPLRTAIAAGHALAAQVVQRLGAS